MSSQVEPSRATFDRKRTTIPKSPPTNAADQISFFKTSQDRSAISASPKRQALDMNSDVPLNEGMAVSPARN